MRAEQTSLDWHAPGLVAGVDEAGRGPLAGPVVAAAVILHERHPIKGLADSKRLTALRREKLFDQICDKALCCSIALASVEEIDRLNILQATLLPMRAEAVVGGDARVAAISAASILAKVHRDRWCREIDATWPQYGFATHKGYGTAAHLAALRTHGACEHHRRSFAPVAEVLAGARTESAA